MTSSATVRQTWIVEIRDVHGALTWAQVFDDEALARATYIRATVSCWPGETVTVAPVALLEQAS